MYASSAADLEAAIEQLQLMSHKQYVQRVATFLERKAEWVLVFRSNLLTRGHNTNNFAEASIRVLKDMVLHRRKAYNAVALVDLVVDIWESYFRLRLLDHAYNRVPAHQLLYHKLLERMPSGAAEKIRPLGDSTYEVPSSTLDVDTAYQVCMDLGTCTCQSGQQGAFCKHQALVHHCYGGNFPNAPVVTAKDRHQLGLLALGDRCRDQAFFQGFRDSSPQETSTSTGPAQPVDAEPEPQQPMDTEPQLEAQGSAGSTHQREDAAELLKKIQEEQWRHHSLAAGNPYYTTALQNVLEEMRKIQKEPQVIASYLAMKAACTSARRRGRAIKVQPTSIARRRPGVSRGAGRVPAGRPAKSSASNKTKRPHTLQLSIKDGVPHAKSHGAGH